METKDKYSRIAKLFDKMEEKMPMNKIKEKGIDTLSGKILEVGIGSGATLKYYGKNSDVTGIDFSIGMLNIAKEKAKALDLKNIKLLEMDIENMSFANETFDSVFSSCVFCTVPNPKKGISEIYRVLKKGGKVVFIEHMKSKNPIINIALKFLNIFTTWILGTSLLRETEKTIRESGFTKVRSENVMLGDVVRFIVAEK